MSLKETNLIGTLTSEDTNLLRDFYIPVLTKAKIYKRAVGYFSAGMLCHAAEGLSALLKSNGKLLLIIGNPIDNDEYEAIKTGSNLKGIYKRINETISTCYEEVDNPLFANRLNLLSTLVADERLVIKFALRRRGMYHDKIGIIEDKEGDKIAFSGSANETSAALLPDYNIESLYLYPSWKEEIYEYYGKPIENSFKKIWNNEANGIYTIDCPSEIYDKFISYKKDKNNSVEEEINLAELLNQEEPNDSWPHIPEYIGKNRYELAYHQKYALNAWKANDFKGILAHATGSGKTITALHGATKLAEWHKQKNISFICIIAVPYTVLADQWVANMELYGYKPIKCYGSKYNWYQQLDGELSDINLGYDSKSISIVVVNATLVSDAFSNLLNKLKLNNTLIVADECHNHGTSKIAEIIPDSRYKLGLSATPFSSDEIEKKDYLESSYGKIIDKYTIENALKDDVLCQYNYYPEIIYLQEEEMQEYEELSASIAAAINQDENIKTNNNLKYLIGKRARLLGSAENKFNKLSDILENVNSISHCLFYCGDGSTEIEETGEIKRDIEKVSMILNNNNIKSSRFTAQESRHERESIISNFKYRYIDAIVAIKVLDEGFDMPSCKRAYILASSRNERQYIQRRGRILRKSEGKDFAEIIDFIVRSPRFVKSEAATNLVKNELERAIEFSRLSNNTDKNTAILKELCEDYDLEYEEILSNVLMKEMEVG